MPPEPSEGIRGRLFLTGLTCVFALVMVAMAAASRAHGSAYVLRLGFAVLVLVCSVLIWLRERRIP